MTSRRHISEEHRAMRAYAHTHGIAFSIEKSRFMWGVLCYVIGDGKARRVMHSPARAWSALRRAARPPAPTRPPSATVRGEVMGIRIVR